MDSLTLAWRNSKPGRPSRVFTLVAAAVRRLSSASTRIPRLSRVSQRCEPMNPAPPETTARPAPSLVAADTSIREAQLPHGRRHVDVAAVDQHRGAHRRLEAGQVEVA